MNRRVYGLALALAMLATACAEPPTTERNQAEGAIAAARAGEAAIYAPDELKAAEAALAKYDAAVAQRDFRQALNLAMEARDTAYEAVKHAGDEKAAVRSQAERLVTDVDALIKQAAIKRGQSPARPPADHPAVDLKAAAVTLQEARTALAQARFPDVVSQLAPLAEQLRKELGQTAPPPARRGR
jgi:hypothetical protein